MLFSAFPRCHSSFVDKLNAPERKAAEDWLGNLGSFPMALHQAGLLSGSIVLIVI